MKKASAEGKRKGVQRAAVQRAQKTGRRRAAQGAERVSAGRGQSRKNASAGAPAPQDASIGIPYALRRIFVMGMVLLAGALVGAAVLQGAQGVSNLPLISAVATAIAPAIAPSASPTPSGPRIGLVSGHRGNDSGAVCPDGLTEAEVNFDITARVANVLRAQGYTVDILDEFDQRLKGYAADALVSIHADSCASINELATGFKVARVLDSKIPEIEDRLVDCLTSHYKRWTGLRFHANTVTFDMTKYHAFYEIDEQTPAAIIETGFLNLDRKLLTEQPEQAAQGIADGIQCFINDELP